MRPNCCTADPLIRNPKKIRPDIQNRNDSLITEDLRLSVSQVKGNIWLEGLFGIEKENLRVDPMGNLALTPHPKVFGDKLKHPFITTDFSESQIEMRTPPLPDIHQMMGFLQTIHDIVSLELNEEYLWPQSIPPVLPDNHKIPIARYDEDGKEAQAYREFLARKYGPKNQMFSGIHFNISLSDRLLEMLYKNSNSAVSPEEYKDMVYLKAIRQLLRYRWLYVLLYGNSPVVDASMELSCKLDSGKVDHHVIGLSIRNSCFGYQNLGTLYPDYSTVPDYIKSVEQMISEGKLASPKELYAPIRPKFAGNDSHISYIEIRFVDIDPFERTGIKEEALRFLHALTLFGILTEEPGEFDKSAQAMANMQYGKVSLYGLDPSLIIHEQTGKSIDIWADAKLLIQSIRTTFGNADISEANYFYAIDNAYNLVCNPGKRPVFDVLEGILKMGYIPFHLQLAEKYLNDSQNHSFTFLGFTGLELSTQLLLREGVKRGVGFEILDLKENFVRFRKGDTIQYVKQATKTSLDDYASILAMENKMITKKILHENQVRTPKGNAYTEAGKAKADFSYYKGSAIVVKPNQTNFGIGITILKKNQDQEVYNRAVDIAFENDNTILIEEFIAGKEFRVFVINDEVVGILHRVPANVKGDGKSTIRELVSLKNLDPLRGKGYITPLEKIQLGEAETIFLALQQKDFDYIPAINETVFLRENSNISTGGDSIDFTDEISESYKKIAVKAARALKVKITGLDMIIKDYTLEATEDNYAIIELNFNPAIHIHCHPYIGKNRKLNEKLMDALGY